MRVVLVLVILAAPALLAAVGRLRKAGEASKEAKPPSASGTPRRSAAKRTAAVVVLAFLLPAVLAGCLGDHEPAATEDFGAVVTFSGWRGHDPARDPFYSHGESFNALVVNRAPIALTGAPRYWIYDEQGDLVKKDRFLGARTDLEPDQGFLVTWDFTVGGADVPSGAYVIIGEFAGYQDRVRIVLSHE